MSARATLLLIDDEDDIRFSLRGIFEDEGWQVLEASSGRKGLQMALDEEVDLIFLDIWMPEMDGMQVLEKLTLQGVQIPVIMISGHGNIETAVTALKQGAFDFIEKPLSLENVLVAAEKALELSVLRRENKELRSRIILAEHEQSQITGQSQAIIRLRELIFQVGATDSWVLITGENGTGKEIAARSIHQKSARVNREMICVNCAAIPEELIESELFGHEKGAFTGADKQKKGKFELANGSTLFLDEIADMSLKAQAKVLRILQEQCFERVGGDKTIHVNVRVLAATNKALHEEIAAGRFRADLFYRLNVFPLAIPPLRERQEDIPELIHFFSERMMARQGMRFVHFTPKAMRCLQQYAWPGNVRELKNFVERLFILYSGQEVDIHMLPPEYQTPDSTDQHMCTVCAGENDFFSLQGFKEARARFEREFLRRGLLTMQGNVSQLAACIGLERTYLYRKLKAFDICVEGEKHKLT